MPDSVFVQENCLAMLTAQMGIATRVQYRRHVPSSRTNVHILPIGLCGKTEDNYLTLVKQARWHHLCCPFLNRTTIPSWVDNFVLGTPRSQTVNKMWYVMYKNINVIRKKYLLFDSEFGFLQVRETYRTLSFELKIFFCKCFCSSSIWLFFSPQKTK